MTFNNAFLIVSSSKGMPLIFFSAGLVGLKNSNKTTPLAARTLSLHMFDVIQKMEGLLLHVQLLGYGGRLRVFFTELRTLLRQNPQLQLV